MEYQSSFSSFTWQYLVGLKTGYQFSTDNTHCDSINQKRDTYTCSGFTLIPYVAASFLERIRIQLAYNIMPQYGSKLYNKMIVMLGYQF
jgi:hypothetical protein